MDKLIEREIIRLIETEKGDVLRLQYVLDALKENKKLYNSDKKYIIGILKLNSKLEDLDERLIFLIEDPPKPIKLQTRKTNTTPLHTDQRYCVHCEKHVWPERQFSVAALAILLLIGVIPGLIYYALCSKKCPICKHDNWSVGNTG